MVSKLAIEEQLKFNTKDSNEHIDGFAEKLSGPCITGLIICFGSWDIIHQPRKIALEGINKFKRAGFLSAKSLEELAETLYEEGHIVSPGEWLKLVKMSL